MAIPSSVKGKMQNGKKSQTGEQVLCFYLSILFIIYSLLFNNMMVQFTSSTQRLLQNIFLLELIKTGKKKRLDILYLPLIWFVCH